MCIVGKNKKYSLFSRQIGFLKIKKRMIPFLFFAYKYSNNNSYFTWGVNRRMSLIQLEKGSAAALVDDGRPQNSHVGQIQGGGIDLDVMGKKTGEVINVSVGQTDIDKCKVLFALKTTNGLTFCWTATEEVRCCPRGSDAWRSDRAPALRCRICWSSACRRLLPPPICLCCLWKRDKKRAINLKR